MTTTKCLTKITTNQNTVRSMLSTNDIRVGFRDIHKYAGISVSKQVRLHITDCMKSGVSGYVTFFGQ